MLSGKTYRGRGRGWQQRQLVPGLLLGEDYVFSIVGAFCSVQHIPFCQRGTFASLGPDFVSTSRMDYFQPGSFMIKLAAWPLAGSVHLQRFVVVACSNFLSRVHVVPLSAENNTPLLARLHGGGYNPSVTAFLPINHSCRLFFLNDGVNL